MLKITEKSAGDVTILDLDGRLVIGEESASLRAKVLELLSENKKEILINMDGVTFIDSVGNNSLAGIYVNVRRQGGRLKFMNLTQRVSDIFQVTRNFTFLEVYDNEKDALKSFGFDTLYCQCPVCGKPSGPPLLGNAFWPPQTCSDWHCNAQFEVLASGSSHEEVLVEKICIRTYGKEYFEILSGAPTVLRVVGRLNLFSSSALARAWQSIPTPRNVVFDLQQASEIDKAGREALLTFLARSEQGSRVVVSLEGLSREQIGAFPPGSLFYGSKAAALTAIGDVSNAPRWLARITVRRKYSVQP